MSVGGLATYAMNDGYIDAIIRGYRAGILNGGDYANLQQCDTLEDIKLHLSSTAYGDFLADEQGPLHTTTLQERCRDKLVSEVKYVRSQALQPFAKFVDYITYQYMIDNLILLLQGAINQRSIPELLEKCHPLGLFETMGIAMITDTKTDQSGAEVDVIDITQLYNRIIIDTPLAPYFRDCLSRDALQDLAVGPGGMANSGEIEIIRNLLHKAYLEDFYRFCREELGGTTAETMSELLEFEADRRAITITQNCMGKDIGKDDREKLYCNFGRLYPEATNKLAKATDMDELRAVLELPGYGEYRGVIEQIGFGGEDDKSLDQAFAEMSVKLCKLSLEQFFHYGGIYAYIKLKEQEQKNIVWIAECVAQYKRSKMNDLLIMIF